jgi:Na+/melibiose symporter-like transporter
MIDLFQIMTAFLTLGLYTTIVCYFFYRLNEKSIDKLEERMDKNETHWREMFMYMNDRIGTKGQ